MTTQKIINSATYTRMQTLLDDAEQLDIYKNSASYTEISEEDLLATTITLPETAPILDVTGVRSSNDAENAIKIYDYIGPLTRTQASDSRLWSTLTHTTFWDYTKNRWPVGENPIKNIIAHWFERKGGGLSALRRNAISRLWWAAHLTVAPWEKDPELASFQSSDRYKYTRILMSQQQNFQDIMENSYGSNLRLRICLLNALGKYQSALSNKDELMKVSAKKINLLLKHCQLDAIATKDLMKMIDDLVKISSEQLSSEKVATV